jgi:hypothetical protein
MLRVLSGPRRKLSSGYLRPRAPRSDGLLCCSEIYMRLGCDARARLERSQTTQNDARKCKHTSGFQCHPQQHLLHILLDLPSRARLQVPTCRMRPVRGTLRYSENFGRVHLRVHRLLLLRRQSGPSSPPQTSHSRPESHRDGRWRVEGHRLAGVHRHIAEVPRQQLSGARSFRSGCGH